MTPPPNQPGSPEFPEYPQYPGQPPQPSQPQPSAAAPGGWDPTGPAPGSPGPAPGAWDPAAAQGAPYGGYAVPPPSFGQPVGDPGFDPLISPDYNGWFSRATALVKAGWRPLAALQAIGVAATMVIQVPVVVWAASLTMGLTDVTYDDPAAAPEIDALFAVIGLTIAGAFVALLVTTLVTVASIRVGVAVATGGQPSVGDALRGSVGRMFPLIGWQIVAGLIIVAGICACVLPAIYLYAVFITVPAVVAFERTNVISRCFQLFHRDLGAAVARIATIVGFTIAAAVLGGILDAIISSVTGATSAEFGSVSSDATIGALVAGSLLSALVTALIGAVAALFTSQLTLTAYADLRARVEPLSTPVLASELGLQPPATAAGPAPTGW